MFESFVTKYNLPTYRLSQINQHFYKESHKDFSTFISLSKEIRDNLSSNFKFSSINLKNHFESKQTQKALFQKTKCKIPFETVLMQHKKERNTLCVSSMIGCPLGCKFCATGQMGFVENLTDREIIDQVLYFQRLLLSKNDDIENIVFMGMGEPLLNLENVLKAYDAITDPAKLGFSRRKITISTAGVIDQLEKLFRSNFKGRLAISLHASNQNLREMLMPIAKTNRLDNLLRTLDKYTQKSNKRVTYEYVLIEKINDDKFHALELSRLLRGRLAHVNLIAYNQTERVNFKTPTKQRIEYFKQILIHNGINATIRTSLGNELGGACGQLSTISKS